MIRLFPLLLLMCSSALSIRPSCPANFGRQELFKKHRGALGRQLVMRCVVKDWNNDLCGGRPRVRWHHNNTLLERKVHHPGMKVSRLRLTIGMLTFTDEGVYSCTLPNGMKREFNVTAHGTHLPIDIDDVVPQQPSDELPNHYYWLPPDLDERQTYVADGDEKNISLFKCAFYVASVNVSAEWPRVSWMFSQIVYNKWVTLPDKNENKVEEPSWKNNNQPPRPHVKILTREVSCTKSMIRNGWRRLPPSGRCYISGLLFRHLKDEEKGDYACLVGDRGRNHLRKNFTVKLQMPGLWSGHGMGRQLPALSFNVDRIACRGVNVTLKCRMSRPSHLALFIYRRIPNASDARNYTLRLLTRTWPEHFFINNPATANRTRVVIFNEGRHLSYTLTNVSEADSGVYQCNTGMPWAVNVYKQRVMTLAVKKCFTGSYKENPNSHNMVLLFLLPLLALLMILAVVCSLCWRSRQAKNTERRRVVVVHPSANAVYPTFQRRRRSDLTDSDATSSCLTPASSTLGSTTALLTPLRPPEVHVQTRHRFTRRSGSASTRWIRSRAAQLVYELPDQADWEVARHRLNIGADIGEGAFGVVRQGVLGGMEVAVKMLKADFTEEELVDLVKEMEVMKLLDIHPNIIRLLGVCTRDGPLCIVNEYAPFGNLRDFLRARRPGLPERTTLPRGLLTYKHLIDFGSQAAAGLEYLSSRSVVHRDIAARNVLVGVKFQAKIADFGLSRQVADYYRKTTEGRLPVKWLAPEALFDHVFTREGDVWSFGILLWEIFSLGGSPYPSIPVERLFVLLNQGYRNEPPFYAFPQVYALMRQCWAQDPMNRPRFPELKHQLESLRGVEEYAQLLREAPPTSDTGHYLSMEA